MPRSPERPPDGLDNEKSESERNHDYRQETGEGRKQRLEEPSGTHQGMADSVAASVPSVLAAEGADAFKTPELRSRNA